MLKNYFSRSVKDKTVLTRKSRFIEKYFLKLIN
jgi:hypothetical protein